MTFATFIDSGTVPWVNPEFMMSVRGPKIRVADSLSTLVLSPWISVVYLGFSLRMMVSTSAVVVGDRKSELVVDGIFSM